jgi:hypothetical protein
VPLWRDESRYTCSLGGTRRQNSLSAVPAMLPGNSASSMWLRRSPEARSTAKSGLHEHCIERSPKFTYCRFRTFVFKCPSTCYPVNDDQLVKGPTAQGFLWFQIVLSRPSGRVEDATMLVCTMTRPLILARLPSRESARLCN